MSLQIYIVTCWKQVCRGGLRPALAVLYLIEVYFWAKEADLARKRRGKIQPAFQSTSFFYVWICRGWCLWKAMADFEDVTQDAHRSLATQSCFSASARWRGHRRRGWEWNTGSQSVGKLFGLHEYGPCQKSNKFVLSKSQTQFLVGEGSTCSGFASLCSCAAGKAASSLWLCQRQISIHYGLPTDPSDTTAQSTVFMKQPLCPFWTIKAEREGPR